MATSKQNAAAIKLLDKWLADESGYDERVWPTIKPALEGKELMPTKPTYTPVAVKVDCPFVVGQPDVIWAAYVVAIAILSVGLMMAMGLMYLVFSHSLEPLDGAGNVGGLTLWMHCRVGRANTFTQKGPLGPPVL